MHNKTINQALEQLKSSEQGLNSSEINSRREQFGKNVIIKEKKKTFLIRFLSQFKNIMVIILLFSAIISLSIAITHKEVYELIEGLVILFIVIMNAFIGVLQENKAQACLDELQKKSASHSIVIRDGKELKIVSEDVVVGDIVLIEAGDIIPADMRLIESKGLTCDESSLTGESISAEKCSNLTFSENTALAERKNLAFSGSLVTAGHGKGVVYNVGNNSEIGKIAKMLVDTKKELTPLQKSIEKIGKFITFSVLSVCLVIFLLELCCVKDSNFVSALMTSVALAVAAIPESLPAVITLIMAMGVQQLVKRKVIIKQLHAVETLGSCEIICTDKTGTLTQNKMKVAKVFCGLNFDDKKTVDFKQLINCMYLCNDAKINGNEIIAEATEKALFEFSLDYYDNIQRKRIYELPFDSNRKMMTTVNQDKTITAYTKGAFDKIINKCSHILLNGEIVELNDHLRERINQANNEMANNALRVLAFCFKPCKDLNYDKELENNMTFLGLAGLRDEPRKEVKKAIDKCFKAGLKPIMITGDHKLTAFAIARELGIADTVDQVLTGDEINKMTDNEFYKVVKNYTVFARVSPEHKVKIVKAYKKMKKIVAMTGDGVNDAPSLKIADIGVGMGIAGTDVVKSVADMIVSDDNFSSIVVAVEEGRKVYSNIQKALEYLMSTNAVEIFGMLFALIFFPNCTFLLPSQMLFVNLVTDSLPAFALGVENVEPDVMTKPPRKVKSNIFSGDVGISIIYQAILQLIIVITMYCTAMRLYNPQIATTMVFFTIIWLQLIHSLNCKTQQSIIGKNLTDNKTFNICFAITFFVNLLVCCCPIFYFIFNLSYLNFNQWIWVLISAFSIV
ncbi:MAG: cation-translocating P-type ATPase, partial [Clostridia bacterium]|nr:cation-translocating P-type ATPase [Clostridia bacterium]